MTPNTETWTWTLTWLIPSITGIRNHEKVRYQIIHCVTIFVINVEYGIEESIYIDNANTVGAIFFENQNEG